MLHQVSIDSQVDTKKSTILPKLAFDLHRFNQNNNITGIMLSNDNRFVQVLQGDQKAINSCLGFLSQHPAHYDLNVIDICAIKHLAYENPLDYREVKTPDYLDTVISGIESEQTARRTYGSAS